MNKTTRSLLVIAVASIAVIGALSIAPLRGKAAPQSNSSSPDTALPWLKTMNGQIVRVDNNQRVELRGTNVLRNEWVYPSMAYERMAIPQLANVWHANLITHGFASAPVVANDAQYLAVLDEYQQLAEQNNMYIIFCYYYPTLNGDQPPNPDVDPAAQVALVNLVQRYRAKSNVMFMLQAEPHSDTWNGQYIRVTWNTLRPMYDHMITAMRAVDNPAPSKHLILASGDGYGRDISPVITDGEVGHPDPITADGGQNIVYSSHPYDTQGGSNNWDYFLPVADAGYPVLVTEFGTGGQMNQSDTIALMNEMNNGTRHISWTSWIFDSEGCPCLLSGTNTNFVPSSPYGTSVRDRIIAEATNFGGGGGPTNTPAPPTLTRTPAPPTATRTRTNTPLPTQTPGGPTATPTLTDTPVPCAASFIDVHSTDYYYAAVNYLYCHGAISGYSDGTFRPGNSTTRAQLSKIVVIAEGFPIDTTGAPHFSDVPSSSPFYSFVETAYNRGLISGYSGGTFRPNSNVTRAQLSKIVVQAQGWGIDTTGGPHFSDVPTSNAFYQFVETAYNHGIISGYSDGTFRPNNSATRGQISKIVFSAVTAP